MSLVMATLRPRHRSDGTVAHQLIFRDGDDPTHKQTSITFDDEAEAKLVKRFLEANGHSFRKAQEQIIEMRSQAPTLNELVTHHLDTLTGVERGTLSRYRSIHRDHIQDSIGRTRIDALDRTRIVKWLQGINRTEKTLKNIHAIVSASINTGIDDANWPIEHNPAQGLKMPKGGGTPKQPMFLTRTQVEKQVERVRHIHAEAPTGVGVTWDPGLLVWTLVRSGIRIGEATALRKGIDTTVNEDGRVILHINRAWKRTGAGLEEGVTKSKASARDVSLNLEFSKELNTYLQTILDGSFLFPNRRGQRLHEGRFFEYYWDPARTYLLGAGVLPRKPRIHDLRHTHASWLIQAGVPLPVIQKRLGHESIDTTVRKYGHLTSEDDYAAADVA